MKQEVFVGSLDINIKENSASLEEFVKKMGKNIFQFLFQPPD